MDLRIVFGPASPQTPDLFITVDDDGMADARAIAQFNAADNFPISLTFVIYDAFGAPLESWEHQDGGWHLVCLGSKTNSGLDASG